MSHVFAALIVNIKNVVVSKVSVIDTLGVNMAENDKKTQSEVTIDLLIADALLRVTAIEKILIEKKICTQDELSKATDEIAKRVAKIVLDKAGVAQSVEDLVTSLGNIKN